MLYVSVGALSRNARRPGQKSRTNRLCLAAAAAISFMVTQNLSASSVYYWDGGGPANGSGPQDGSGTWDDVTPNWLAGSTTAGDTNWTDGSEANFSYGGTGNSAYTVTLGTNITTSQIDLNNPGSGASYTFNLNGHTLTTLSSASGDGINVGPGSSTTFTNGTLIDAANPQTAGNPGISMRGGLITFGPGAVIKTDYISDNTPTYPGTYDNEMDFNGATIEAAAGTGNASNGKVYNFYLLYQTNSDPFNAYIGAGGLTVDTSTIQSFDVQTAVIDLNLEHNPSLSAADGGLTKIGTGTLDLDSSQSYTGPTTVNGGTLVLNAYQTEASSNYVVNSGAVLEAGVSNAVVGVSGGNLITLNSGATLTTADGVTAHLGGVDLNGGTVASGAPDANYGSWALNSNGYLLVTQNDTATLSATDFYMNSGSYLGVNAGATLLDTGSFQSGSAVGLYGTGLTVFSGNNAGFTSGSVTIHNNATLQVQANAANTYNGVSYAINNVSSGGLTVSDGSGSATLQLRSDSTVSFAGTTTIGGAYLAIYNFDVNNIAALANSGPQANTLSIGSFAVYGTTVNVTGGNGYALSVGSITNGYGQPVKINAVSANVTFGSIGLSSAVSSASLNAAGGTITVSGALANSGPTTVTGSDNVNIGGKLSGTTLTMNGSGILTLDGSNTYTGVTQVNSGTVAFAPNYNSSGIQTSAAPGGLNISNGAMAQVKIAANHANRTLLATSNLSIAGTSAAWTGTLDLGNNDLDLAGGSLATVTNQLKQGYANGHWNGSGGIVSSAAAADASHLTALGVISNNVNGNALYGSGGNSLGLFDGTSPGLNDVLVKYTYYGDANLDGKVDGTDYSLIDNGYLNHLTGWYNGDFNYDGVIDGSDYTLIDNAFNSQGAALSDQLANATASPTAQLADVSGTSSVPEPASFGILTLGALGLLGRRRRV